MLPGDIDYLVPGKLGAHFPVENRVNEAWETGKPLIEVPGKVGNDRA